MALRINFNYASLQAQRGLSGAEKIAQRAGSQLSSGLRINQAADDTAGMSISETLKNQVRGLNMAHRNVQDASSMLQVAEGALTETHSLLARMRELAVQASNDTLQLSDRLNANAEFTALYAEIDRIATTTQFDGIVLLDNSSVASGLTLQVGANRADSLTYTISSSKATNLYANFTAMSAAGTLNVSYQSNASAMISAVDSAVNTVSGTRASIGAMQNRFASATNYLSVAAENTAAANSRVADADIASSMSELVRAQILQQAGISVLAQANQSPALVLQLLR
ncbi:MAG: flagellin FliC [Proteobacteria bacterium]|jgi:flagellin|nr:flagellin FliC [Pseudomonadota bacterium]NBX46540.1 flagellin FliC [Chloroflexota bacterium]NBQ32151.1 flagellin FliC [Pseudomonadota bacterium]NBQ63297.1 flagellin FliC [Pseudomonadota bacterium]NBT03419.1 flagellin FliC [Pseudomonadota bacterium]